MLVQVRLKGPNARIQNTKPRAKDSQRLSANFIIYLNLDFFNKVIPYGEAHKLKPIEEDFSHNNDCGKNKLK